MALLAPHRLEEVPGGVGKGFFDIQGGDDEVDGVHVGDGVLEEDGLMWRYAWGGALEAGRYVRVEVGVYGTYEDSTYDFDLSDHAYHEAPAVRVGPVPVFVEGADNVCPFRGHGDSSGDDAAQSLGQEAEEVGGEVVVRLRWEAVVALGFVLSEVYHGFLHFLDCERVLLYLLAWRVVEDPEGAGDFVLAVWV